MYRYVRELFIKEASWAHFHSVMARIQIAYRLDIEEKVKRIEAPTLIIYGANDHFTKKDSIRLTELIPNTCLQSLPGGHLAHIHAPKPFTKLIDRFVQANEEAGVCT
jgi:pimeloyl-ACP methyl ester carboxylesterase